MTADQKRNNALHTRGNRLREREWQVLEAEANSREQIKRNAYYRNMNADRRIDDGAMPWE